MRELPELAEVKAAWLDQPDEGTAMDIERIHLPRTSELFSHTRSEIISSIVAALFFAITVAGRFAPRTGRLVQFGWAALIVWAAVTVIVYRQSIWPREPPLDALARSGSEHYREELVRRRDHLRNTWIWHGPLVLAFVFSAAIFGNRIVVGRLWGALPVFLLLVAWSVNGTRRRMREAAELEQEIREK